MLEGLTNEFQPGVLLNPTIILESYFYLFHHLVSDVQGSKLRPGVLHLPRIKLNLLLYQLSFRFLEA